MTFSEKKLEEFDDYLEKYIPQEQWGIFRYEIVKAFLEQALLDKEQEVLERVHGCLPDVSPKTPYQNDMIYEIRRSLDKEFKQ